jgi:hypothetical protein
MFPAPTPIRPESQALPIFTVDISQTLPKPTARNPTEALTARVRVDYLHENQKQKGNVLSLIMMMKMTSRILRTLNKGQIANGHRPVEQMSLFYGGAAGSFPADRHRVVFRCLRQRRQAKEVYKCLETHVRGPIEETAVPMQDKTSSKRRLSFHKKRYPKSRKQLP